MDEVEEILVPIRFECGDCFKTAEFLSRLKFNNMITIDCDNYEISIIQKRIEKKYEFKILIICKICKNNQIFVFDLKNNTFKFKCKNCIILNGFIIYYQFLDNETESNAKPMKLKFISSSIEHWFNFTNLDSIEKKFEEIQKIFKNINRATNFYFNAELINKSQSFEKNKIYDRCEIEIDDY